MSKTPLTGTAPEKKRPLVGVAWMLAAGLSFVILNVLVKYVGHRLPAVETAFLRYALGLVFVLPMMKTLLAARLGRSVLVIFSLRGVVHTVGVGFWFYAMTQIPLAEVTAINYLNPIFVTIGAALFFGESLALRRILAIVVALAGAMLILRPGFRELSPGHLAMLVTAVTFAASYLIMGRVAGRVDSVVIVAMLSITVTIGLAPFALYHWVQPNLHELTLLFLTAAFATFGHYAMTLAFAAAPLTVTQPVNFLQLVWSVSLGALLFHEGIDPWVVLGGVMIFGSVSFITWREAMLKRRVTPVVNETKG